MNELLHRSLTLLVTLAALWVAQIAVAQEAFTFQHENVLGTSLELRVGAAGREEAEAAEARVLAEIDRLAAIYSTYAAGSELLRWQQLPVGQNAALSPELFEVLQASDRYRELTGGAFQPATELLTALWSQCEREQRLPLAEELAAARRRIGAAHWRLDERTMSATRLSDAPLSLNAIAKGAIIDRACAAALAGGRIESLILNIGGDLRVCGPAEQLVDIADPRGADNSPPLARLRLTSRAVAGSGGERRGFDILGRHYAHVFDPRTGRPVFTIASATVVAPRAIDADALATACCVLAPQESLALVDRLPNVACLLVTSDGRTLASREWAGLLAQPDRQLTAAQGAAGAGAKPLFNGGMELKIDFEINNPGGGQYRRPYVAVWIEDAKGFPVRTLILWVAGSRWVPELRRWYRSDQVRRKLDEFDLVARAGSTRKPGQYAAIWDGRDGDERLCPAGEYTVYIEAAREHGTNQLIKHKLTLGAQPLRHELAGNIEIKAAQLEYRRAAPADKSH